MPATQVDRVEGLTTSIVVKAAVLCATTANITLANLQTIDGVVLVETYPYPDRVLVKDQNDPTENGIYEPRDGTAWVRSLDIDGTRDLTDGTLVWVRSGDTNSGLWKSVITDRVVVFGTTEINWEFVMGGTITAIPGEPPGPVTNLFEITNEQRGTIATGFAGSNPVAWSFEILGYYLTADISCSIEIEVWIKAWADDSPPLIANKITASAPAELVSQQQKKVTTLTGWTTAFAAGTTGNQIYYNINSVSGDPGYYNFTLICLKVP